MARCRRRSNYRGYPKSICTSINHVVCHGIPGERKLENGDILNIDVTVILDGWHGDHRRMYVAGTASTRARNLMDVTYEAHDARRARGEAGRDAGRYRPRHPELSWRASGFSVVRDFCGHGIGRRFHEPPNVLHFGRPGEGPVLRPGMFFTIEPMVNAGRPEVKVLDDGWTAVTRDRSLSAQFEHMIGVTEDGLRDLHPVARRAGQAALREWREGRGNPSLVLARAKPLAIFHQDCETARHCCGPSRVGKADGGLLTLARMTPASIAATP